MKRIYLDNSATMRVRPAVVKEIVRVMKEDYGNPSSPHSLGEKAGKEIEKVRKQIALELGCKANEIYFTSGATESNNLVILGNNCKRILLSDLEHSSIQDAVINSGKKIVKIGIDSEGKLDLIDLEKKVRKGDLVCTIHGHNEIGVLQDLRSIGKICKKKGAKLFVDAVQSFGKVKIKVGDLGISALSGSGHKIGGPKGIGFVFIKSNLDVRPLIFGGGQENGLRNGTENVAGIVGLGKALELMKKVDSEKVRKLRDYFMKGLMDLGGMINGSLKERLWNNIHVSFGIDGDDLVSYLDGKGIMCSARSACLTEDNGGSKVLKSIGLTPKEIKGSIRFVLSEENTKGEIDVVLKEIKRYLGRRLQN